MFGFSFSMSSSNCDILEIFTVIALEIELCFKYSPNGITLDLLNFYYLFIILCDFLYLLQIIYTFSGYNDGYNYGFKCSMPRRSGTLTTLIFIM